MRFSRVWAASKNLSLGLIFFAMLESAPASAGGGLFDLTPALLRYVMNYLKFVKGSPLPNTAEALFDEEQLQIALNLLEDDSEIASKAKLGWRESRSSSVKDRTVSGPLPQREREPVARVSSENERSHLHGGKKKLVRTATSKPLQLSQSDSVLIKIQEWSTQPDNVDFHPLACHYYAYVVTDDELADFLSRLDMREQVNYTFWANLVRCFANTGFSNGLPSKELIDALLRPMTLKDPLRDPILAKLKERTQAKEKLTDLETDAESIELSSFKLKKYSDEQIAKAWTLSDALLFQNVSALKSEPSVKPNLDGRISLSSKACIAYQEWVYASIKPNSKSKVNTKFLARLPSIANEMLKLKNFNGAFSILVALHKDDFLDRLGHNDPNLNALRKFFDPMKNYYDQVKVLQASEDSAYLPVVQLYPDHFIRVQENNGLGKDEYKKAISMAEFLSKMAKDQNAAAKYVSIIDAKPELVKFFIKLAR